jgi:hypothetical protein
MGEMVVKEAISYVDQFLESYRVDDPEDFENPQAMLQVVRHALTLFIDRDLDGYVDNIMTGITRMEQPNVFTVTIMKSDHSSGFRAMATLRAGHDRAHLEEITTWGETSREAAQKLFEELKETFGPCPHCGRIG